MGHFNTKPPVWQILKLPCDLGEHCLLQTPSPFSNGSTDACYCPQVATRATLNLALQAEGNRSPPKLSL